MKKQLICIFLAIVLLCSAIPFAAMPAKAAEAEVTRAQWIQSLVKTFDMTVEDNNYPDNYYTDLTGQESYYRDILVAVEFGVIDEAPGTAFRPEEAATREFAAHTLNFALGYQLDEEAAYTFSESASVTYPDDIQIAINRGWFALSGGAFLPEQAITAAESSAMLADAAQILAGDKIQENYKATFVYADGVVEIPDGTAVEFFGEDTVYITYSPKTINVGDTFAVYNDGIPVIGIAQAVSVSEDITTVIYTPGPDEALVDYDYQTTVEADLEQFQGEQATTYAARNGSTVRAGAVTHEIKYDKGKKELYAKLPLKLADGVEVELTAKLSNMKIDSKAKFKQEAYLILNADTTFIAGVEVDYLKAGSLPKSVTIGSVPVAGIGRISLEAEFEISGELVVTIKGHIRTGFTWDKYDGFRFIAEYKRKSFHLSAEITVYAGLKLSAGVDVVAAEGNLYITLGDTTTFKVDHYEDGKLPKTCQDEVSYTSSSAGYYLKVFAMDAFHDAYEILGPNRSNPSYYHYHYEDGKLVDKCTRGSTSSNHYTSPSSKWFNPGSSSGRSSYTGSSGEPVVIYKISLNENNEATITSYQGNAYSLSIPKTIDGYTVVAIGSKAFQNNKNLHIVKFPDTVTTIGEYAFAECTNLETVILPDSLTTLHGRAFGNCTSLRDIEIPKSLTTVKTAAVQDTYKYRYYGPFAFSGLERATIEDGTTAIPHSLFAHSQELEYVQIPATVTSIGSSAFSQCTGLKSVDLPEGMTIINDCTFYNCDGLTDVVIPDSVTVIEEDAFGDCDGLVSVTLSKNLTDLHGNAFGSCDVLNSVHIPKSLATVHWATTGSEFAPGGLTYYGPFTYSGLKEATFEEGTAKVVGALFYRAQKLETVQLADTMTSISSNAFYDCEALKQIEIPEGVTTIWGYAFQGSGLTSVEIPDSVTAIYGRAFMDCEDLAMVKLSKNLATLYGNAFGNCSSLKEIHIPRTLTTVELDYTDGYSRKIYYGPFCNSGLEKATFEEGTTSVVAGLFYKANNLKEVTLPNSMTSIGKEAFYACSSLNNVEIPESVTKLDLYAFFGCEALEKIEIPSGVTEIPYYAFQNCSSLKSVKLPEGLVTIRGTAFAGCESLLEILLPDSLQTLDYSAFQDCTALATVKLPDTLTKIEESTFQNCDSLTTIKLPSALTEVGSKAFYDSDALTNITIPDGVTIVKGSAFYDCDSLESVHIGAGVTELGGSAFYNCDSLKTVTIPGAVTKVGSSCFYDCDALETATVATGKLTISLGSSLFEGCDVLKNVDLSYRAVKVPAKAFYGCKALEEIVIPFRVTSLESQAFANCTQLKKVVTHPALATIPTNAFSYPNLTVIYGTEGSAAQTYADTNGYQFVANTVTANSVTSLEPQVEMISGGYQWMQLAIDPADFGDSVSFRCSDSDVVKVSDRGFLTGVSAGTAIVKVTVGSQTASCEVTVVQPVTGITLNTRSVTLEMPNTYQLTATVKPAGASQNLLWTSDNEAAATVDQNGLVTAVGNGKAVITAAAKDGSGISASCTVTVIDPGNIPVSSIELNKTELSREALLTETLTATVKPANAANQKLTWTSSDPSVATVDADGTVKTLAKGTAVITVSSTDGSGISARCTVTVTNDATVVDTVNGLESPHNYPVNTQNVWVYTLPGSTGLDVTFDEKTAVEKGFDDLVVSDGAGNVIGTYTGTELAGQTVSVPGDTVRITLISDEAGTDWGFKVTAITPVGTEHTHNYGPWTTVKDANCTESGIRQQECTCGDTRTEPIPALDHNYINGLCTRCNTPETTKPDTPDTQGVTRLAGETRYETSMKIADEMKNVLGVEKFDSIILASSEGFADALAGSYLAAVKEAPIIIGKEKYKGIVCDYVNANLAENGTVYVLGGEGAVPEAMLSGITVTKNFQRLAGNDRYTTNLAILAEAGVAGKDILVATGQDFADSLSASATGLPILLVNGKPGKTLSDAQKQFLVSVEGNIYIIGGESAVPASMVEQIEAASGKKTERIAGGSRYETSIEIAKAFLTDAESAVVAYASTFPDGLCGGPLAYAVGAPLILTKDGKTEAPAYTKANGITSGYVLGGDGLISDGFAQSIFQATEILK